MIRSSPLTWWDSAPGNFGVGWSGVQRGCWFPPAKWPRTLRPSPKAGRLRATTMTRPLPTTGSCCRRPGATERRPGAAACRARAGLARRHLHVLFDLDGVLTQTAKVHAAAWKEMFDAFLRERSEQTGPFRPFKIASDYVKYVDGKLRQDGVRAFLASRTISLPEGSAGDPPTALTVHGLGNRKNDLVLDLIRRRGVDVYEGSVRFVEAVRAPGCGGRSSRRARTARPCWPPPASSTSSRCASRHRRRRGHLRGKPAPDTFPGGHRVGRPASLLRCVRRRHRWGRGGPRRVVRGGWSASTAAGRPRPCAATAPTRWSAT